MKTEFDLEKVEELASKGLTQSQIAEYFGVSPSTISAHKKDSDFARALAKGKAHGIAKVANALFDKATGGDTTAMIFYLRARAGWVEPQRIKQEITQDTENVKKMSTEELNASIVSMLKEWGDEEAGHHVNAFLHWVGEEIGKTKQWLRDTCHDG